MLHLLPYYVDMSVQGIVPPRNHHSKVTTAHSDGYPSFSLSQVIITG